MLNRNGGLFSEQDLFSRGMPLLLTETQKGGGAGQFKPGVQLFISWNLKKNFCWELVEAAKLGFQNEEWEQFLM